MPIPSNLRVAWWEFVADLALKPPYIWAGSQAIYSNIEWTFPAQLLLADESMTVESIGYTPSKIRQLTTHYQNKETIDRAKRHLDERLKAKKYGSGVWDFRGIDKKTTKQDFCLTAGVITYYPPKKHTRVFIHYRTVELIFRFRADLIFLRDVILPQFQLDRMPPDTITLRFVNCTIHPMFGVMFLLDQKRYHKLGRWLDLLEENNPAAFRQWARWTKIHLDGGYKKYATAARVQNFVNRQYNEDHIERLRRVLNDDV